MLAFFERQEQRDEKARAEQAQRDQKILSLFEQQAQRDERARAEQAQRDERIFGMLQQQAKILEQLHQTAVNPARTSERFALAASDASMSTPRPKESAGHSMPHKKGSQRQGTSGAAAHSGTPQVAAQRIDQFSREEYIALSKSYADMCRESSLEETLDMLGDGWRAAWGSFGVGNKQKVSRAVGAILKEYYSMCDKARIQQGSGRLSEDIYQKAFGMLSTAVQNHLGKTTQSTGSGVHWRDTHTTLIKRGDGRKRKPDGCFLRNGSTRLCWQDIVVAVEIKGDAMDGGTDLIRGQLLQDF
ncbi:hypothetical protein LPJ56_001282, partial [Coemansia sp. RSA 2599]